MFDFLKYRYFGYELWRWYAMTFLIGLVFWPWLFRYAVPIGVEYVKDLLS